MARAVISNESAGRRVVRTITPRAMALIGRRSIDKLGGIGARRAAEYAGRPDRRADWIGCEITGKEPVCGKVAAVVAAIVIPGDRRRALSKRRQRAQRRQASCGICYSQFS